MNKTKISLGIQSGDEEAGNYVHPKIIALRKLLEDRFSKVYYDEIQEFSIIFRIDGKIEKWHKEGCENIRRNKKDKYITVDLYVPEKRWQSSIKEFKEYLASNVKQAFNLFIARLKKDKITSIRNDLLTDVEEAISVFLKTN